MILDIALEQELKLLQAKEAALEKRVVALETLLAGITRTSSPDGIPGHVFPGRVGIMTSYFVTQPIGEGAALSVATGFDKRVVYVQHDGSEGIDGLGKQSPIERIGIQVNTTDPNPIGTNTAIVAIATNAPHGNIAVDAKAQYSPNADTKVVIVKQTEWKNP